MRIWSCFALALLGSPAGAQDASAVFARVSPSVVTVNALDEAGQPIGQGSGVVIAAGRVATNCHVVRDANGVRIAQGERSWPAVWTEADLPRDICVLAVEGLEAPAAPPRAGQAPEVGERVFAVGNPLGLGLAVSAGLISGVGMIQGESRLFSSAAQSPGSSGGGLFDGEGRLVGLTAATMTAGQNVNLVLPAAWIDELPGRVAAPPTQPPDPPTETDWHAEAEKTRLAADWPAMETVAKNWIADRPNVGLAHQYLGTALMLTSRYREAEEEFGRSLAMEPDNCVTRIYLATAIRAADRPGEAEAMMDKAAAACPAHWLIWDKRGHWRMKEGNHAEARDHAQRVTLLAPVEASGWRQLAMAEWQLGNYAAAAAASRVWLWKKPEDADAREYLARALVRSGEIDRARKTLLAVQSVTGVANVAIANAWIELGVAEEKRQRLEDAESAYRQALAFDPGNALALRNLAMSQQQSGRLDEAAKSLDRAIALPGDDVMNRRYQAERLLLRQEYGAAATQIEEILRLDPNNRWAPAKLGYARKMAGDHAAAREAFSRATELDPADVDAWAGLGQALIRLGDLAAAESAFAAADRLKPDHPDLLLELAVVTGKRGRFEQALSYSERSLAQRPGSGLAWSSKGYALQRLGRLDEAAKALETAVKLQPDVANPWINLGETRLRQRQLAPAINALRRALELAPEAADVHLYLGQAYLSTQQPELARTHFEAALARLSQPGPALAGLVIAHLAGGRAAEALTYWNSLKLRDAGAARRLRANALAQRLPGAATLPE